MDRAEAAGITGAVVLHAGMLALFLWAIYAAPPRLPERTTPQPIDVYVTDDIGLRSMAPPQIDDARQAEAPTTGNPQDAAASAAPEISDSQAVQQTPTPPAPAPRPDAQTPAPPKPPSQQAPAQRRERLPRPDVGEGQSQQRARESRLGPNFLKGIQAESKGKAPRARAQVGAQAMSSIAAAIARQIKPCYELGALGGTSAMDIVTVLRLRFRPDGSVANVEVATQEGVTGENRAYARQMAELSRRAVLRCAPLQGLPANLYEGGWDDFDMGFIPRQLG